MSWHVSNFIFWFHVTRIYFTGKPSAVLCSLGSVPCNLSLLLKFWLFEDIQVGVWSVLQGLADNYLKHCKFLGFCSRETEDFVLLGWHCFPAFFSSMEGPLWSVCLMSERNMLKALLQIANGNGRFVAVQPVGCATMMLITSLVILLSHFTTIAILYTRADI
jgi:hypothetical protein